MDILGPFVVAGIVAGIAFLYYIHAVYLKPYKDCGVCQGSAKIRSGILKSTFHHCPACAGTGRKLRWLRKRYEKRHPNNTLIWGQKR